MQKFLPSAVRTSTLLWYPWLAIVFAVLLLPEYYLLGLVLLGTAFFAILKWLNQFAYNDLGDVLGFSSFKGGIDLPITLLSAIALGLLYRQHLGLEVFLRHLDLFLFSAAAIGFTEELLFRGVAFAQFDRISNSAIIISATLHAAYKAAVQTPYEHQMIFQLFVLTFVVGLFLGWTRKRSSSIWLAILFHVLFDVIVYGDSSTPYWVW